MKSLITIVFFNLLFVSSSFRTYLIFYLYFRHLRLTFFVRYNIVLIFCLVVLFIWFKLINNFNQVQIQLMTSTYFKHFTFVIFIGFVSTVGIPLFYTINIYDVSLIVNSSFIVVVILNYIVD